MINTKKPLYLNFIEELSIKKSELIGNLMTAEVMESSRPVRTHKLLVSDVFNLNVLHCRLAVATGFKQREMTLVML